MPREQEPLIVANDTGRSTSEPQESKDLAVEIAAPTGRAGKQRILQCPTSLRNLARSRSSGDGREGAGVR